MADDPAFMAAAADGKTPVRNRPGGQTEAYCEIRTAARGRTGLRRTFETGKWQEETPAFP